MVSDFAPKIRRRRVFRRVLLCVGLAGALATAYAFRTFFARPGEAALRLIPKNAIVFGTADLSPSPTQTLVFKKIDDALARNGLDKKIDGALTDIAAHGSVGDELRPFAKRAAAFALIAPETPGGDFKPDESLIVYFGLTDGPSVDKILSTKGHKLFWRGTPYYQFDKNGPGLMVVGDTLVATTNPKLMHEVELIAGGQSGSIVDRPDFAAERAKLDADSNLMVFVTPDAFSAFTKDAPKEAKEMLAAQKWLALGVAIRDGGIALSFDGAYDSGQAKWLQTLSTQAPIRSDLMAVLPKGAYGVTALSQPSKYFECMEQAVGEGQEGKKMIRDMEDSLSKEMNLSLRQDVLPAFEGNAIAAIYPSESADKVAGVDVLVLVDDQNGAKPGALAERVREYAEREITKDGKTEAPFQVMTEGNVKKYRLSAKPEHDMQTSMSDGIGEGGALDRDIMSKDKTITWAIVGDKVVGSSSAKLLDRAIASLNDHQNGLNTDSLWAPAEKNLLDGSQILSTFSVARIAEGFQNTMHMDKMGDDSKVVGDIVDALKGLTEPFSIKSKTTDGAVSMKLFIPMDYDRLFDMIGRNMDKK